MLHFSSPVLFTLAFASASIGCGSWHTPSDAITASAGAQGGSGSGGGGGENTPVYEPDPAGLHVELNQIKDGAGRVIVLHGLNRSGTEYACVNGTGIFDGPSDEASIVAMTTWNINTVRIPLNESCWLGINGVSPSSSGDTYKAAIRAYVNLLHKYRLTPILELHWTAEGTRLARGLQPMPDADHAPAFWADLASTFIDDTGVIFELFNEPFPDLNHDTPAAWACWRDGCEATPYPARDGTPGVSYQAVGMQALVNTVRDTGATQLILLGGIQYSNTLTQWLANKPVDPLDNLAVAWHVYNNNPCNKAECWKSVLTAPMAVGQLFPIVATEIGENDCANSFVNPLMQALDAYGGGYLAWSWNAGHSCTPATRDTQGAPWQLISDYNSGTPTSAYALAIRDHFVAGTR